MRHHVQRPHPRPALPRLHCVPLRVPAQLPPVIVERTVGIMQQRRAQPAHRPLDGQLLMDLPLLIAPQLSAKQAQHPVILPSRMPDLVTQEEVAPLDLIPLERAGAADCAADCAADFLRQLLRHPFVRVDDQHPLLRRLCNRPVLLRSRRQVLVLQHPRSALARDLRRLVGAEGIHHQHLVGELQSGQTVGDPLRLVQGCHDSRQAGHY